MDSAAVLRAALELFQCRNYSGVVAVCADAVESDPDNIELRLLLARALLALRRDVEAQQELSRCLQDNPRCPDAYLLLGELAMRRDELKSAEIFFRETMRLDPSNRDASELLDIILAMHQPTGAVEKLPAATVPVGCPSHDPQPRRRGPRFAYGTCDDERVARFGEFLVEIGALSEVQLRAALAYQRTAGIRIGTAASALGFVSEPKVEWAAHAFHGKRTSH